MSNPALTKAERELDRVKEAMSTISWVELAIKIAAVRAEENKAEAVVALANVVRYK